MDKFLIEITDTYGGEANYSWVKRYIVRAKSIRGAITKLAKSQGAGWRKDYDTGCAARYNLQGACVCCFVNYLDDSMISSYNGTQEL